MRHPFSTLSPACWSKGLYLAERARRLPTGSGDDLEPMHEAVRQWCSRAGLPAIHLRARLAADGLDERAFAAILATRECPSSDLPAWAERLEEVIRREYPSVGEADLPDEEWRGHLFYPFVRPFLEWAKMQVLKQCRGWRDRFGELPFEETTVIRSVLGALCRNLLTLSTRVLIYELNLLRVEGRLQGETPEDRFDDFVAGWISRKPDIVRLLHKYPVLARLMAESAQRLTDAVCEAVGRFLGDRNAIFQRFDGDFARLAGISSGMGDLHRGGRSVMIMEFASGHRLVYKPRSLAVDRHFGDLLERLNDWGLTPALRPLRVLDRGEYGWQQFAAAAPCDSPEQVRLFYRRLGSYAAVLHVLHGTDMHMDNVIASGEHPYIVDLESLFQNAALPGRKHRTALDKATEELAQSVLRTGLLPASLFKSGSFKNVELSGIGGHAGQRLPRPVYGLENVRTDRMRMVKKTGYSKAAKNRPVYAGREMAANAYMDEVVAGFEQAYRLMLRHRDELLADAGPILAFRSDPVRVILRHTQSYATMLEASLHPDYLRDGLDRVHLFDYLWRAVEANPQLADVVPLETRDLLAGDIPLFQSRVDSRSIWDSRGREVSGFFASTPLEQVISRIERLSEEDCEKQARYVRISLATMLKRWDLKSYRSDFSARTTDRPCEPEQFVQQACGIGERLLQSAFWGDDGRDVNWIGIGASLNERWLFTPLDASLYDGVLGVALFYAYLADVSGNRRYRLAAEAALHSARDFLQTRGTMGSLSAFHGYASVAYVLSHLALLWNDRSLLEQALTALGQCDSLVARDELHDLIGGSAGALLVALRLHRLTGAESALRLALHCGEHLLKRAVTLETGCGWISGLEGETPLVGLSHGTAGIAWALAELYGATGDERFLACSRGAIAYERTMFMPEEGNWADLRYREERKRLGIAHPVAWCHGAAGIGLGRLMTLPFWQDELMQREIATALQTTLREGFGGSHCQCHGDFGNLELLLVASGVLGDAAWLERARRIATIIVQEAGEKGWCCGIPQDEDTPSLMLGLAGIGYGLLRLAAPDRVPPVVVLGYPARDVP